MIVFSLNNGMDFENELGIYRKVCILFWENTMCATSVSMAYVIFGVVL